MLYMWSLSLTNNWKATSSLNLQVIQLPNMMTNIDTESKALTELVEVVDLMYADLIFNEVTYFLMG